MAVSQYKRDLARLWAESEGRSKAFRKAAKRSVDKRYGAEPIIRGGKTVGVRLGEDGEVACIKARFATPELAQESLDYIASKPRTRGDIPKTFYRCPYCDYYHTTRREERPTSVDDDAGAGYLE